MTRLTTATALLVGVFSLGLLSTRVPLVAQVRVPTNTMIMSGLNNPRGLAIGPDGGIYVAEAGTGGAGPCVVAGANETRCFGLSGSISRWLNGVQQRIVSGVPSHAQVTGNDGIGANDLAFEGSQLLVLLGLGADPAVRTQLGPHGWKFGKLFRVSLTTGELTESADVTAYEAETNPAGGPADSNPFGLLILPSLRIVSDAGANALLSVLPNGLVNTIAVFPSRPARSTDAVPTSVAVGPDGAYYVSELSGVPFSAGAANIYRVLPRQTPQVFRSGFTTITDIAFGPDGSLYVVQHSNGPVFFGLPGDLVKIAPDGTRTVLVANLNRPTSVAVASDNSVYYTNRGITAGQGEVWKYTP